MSCSRRTATAAAALAATALLAAGCAPADSPDGDEDTIVLADPQPLGQFNPIDGYGELGVSPLYDGLLRPSAPGDRELPDLEPALAAADPVSNAEATVWDVELRSGVTFSDGSELDAEDVVATYSAITDPESASAIAGSYEMIETVTAVDDLHVRFELGYSYAAFPVLLLVGIAPSEALTGGPALDSDLNSNPVGTGPYVLTDLSAEQAVFEAREDYWDGPPQVQRLVVTHMPDDNARAQRMSAGGLDGTVLPPRLAASFAEDSGLQVDAVQSADWRGVSLPADNPFTADEQARLAMNIGVDRAALIQDVLAGHGRPAYTPAAAVYGDGFDAGATFDYNPERAAQILDAAGWREGPDGVRTRDGDRAELTILYDATDSLRRDVATGFAAAMAELGIDITVEGTSWDEMDQRLDESAILLGGGDKPYDLDTQLCGVLHSRGPQTSPYDNPADLTIPGVDDALDEARRSLDPQVRTDRYRQVQQAYIEHPTHVFLVFLDHTYVRVQDDWQTGSPIMEPHSHGVTWGPWWNLSRWTR